MGSCFGERNALLPTWKPKELRGTLTHSELALHGRAVLSCHSLSALWADGLLDGVVHVVVHRHGILGGYTTGWNLSKWKYMVAASGESKRLVGLHLRSESHQ